MPPKRKPKVVRWLVQSKFTGQMFWRDEPLTPYLEPMVNVLGYGMDDGTVRWEV